MGNRRVKGNAAETGQPGQAAHGDGARPTPPADLTSLLEEVLDATINLQRADFGHVQLYDEASGTLKIVVQRGLGPEYLEHFAAVGADDTSGCGLALKEGRRIVIEDVMSDPGSEPHRAIAALTGYRGMICTPLFARGGGKSIGMFTTLCREPCRPTERDLQLTDLLARQAVDAIGSRVAEQRLRDSEEYFRLALEAGNMGIWEWDAATTLITADKAHRALFGLSAHDGPLPNEAYWAYMEPQESKIGAQRARNALENGTDIQLELPIRPSEGVTRWIAVRGRPRNSGSGSIIGISYDITDRKHREERLRESESRLKAAADLVNLGLYSWNPQTDELHWDAAVRAMWGLPPDAPVTYDAWRAGIHPADLERVESVIAQCSDPGSDGRYDVEYRVIGIGDGVERWIATRGQTCFEQGKAVAFHGAALDVTDHKRAEQLLERRVDARNRELAEANAALVAEIEERRLVTERFEIIQAELSHSSRLSVAGQIAAMIAHEISQPLTATLNSVNVARRLLSSGDPGQSVALREVIEEAGHEIERASEILHRLRLFIRRGSVHRVPEPVAALVEEAVAFTAVGPNARGVAISQYFDPLVPKALVDRVQIQQVISNLVRNSLEAMCRQSRRELTVASAAADDAFLELSVSDNGPGVADEMVPSLFEPFKTDKPGGMGLGLSICKSIVEAHGGRIAYEPSFDGGSVFRFTLETPPGEAMR